MKQFTAICATVCLISTASGQIITSPDNMWTGTIDPNSTTGQLTGITVNGVNNIFETLFYESSDGSGGFTWRVEQNYSPVSQNIGANSASFVSMRNDGRIRLDASVEMLNGLSGGALFITTYTNVSTTVENFQPYFYADVDADPGFGGDSAQWLAASNAIEQFDTGALFWIGGAEVYTAWEIDVWPILRSALDAGVNNLLNSGGGGLDDWTGALSGPSVSLSPGESVSMIMGVGGEGIGGATCPSCACVFDPDPACDIFDFRAFQNLFVVGDPCACLMDPDPACDIFDFLAFQNQFVVGCP